MPNANQLVTNPDGSINTAFYMARGRRMRSEQAHKLGATVVTTPPKATASIMSRLFAALRLRNARA